MIELPKDAEGREIPLDTTTLYDESGQPLKVRVFQYSPEFGKWLVHCWFNAAEMSSRVSKYYLEPHDSWEKLEEDLSEISKGTVCHYFHKGDSNTCEGCPAAGTGSCWPTMARGITSRIRKLRGDTDA